MRYDFDNINRRTGTGSLKWDFIYHDNLQRRRNVKSNSVGPGELLPMWIADMDFQTAQPIIEAMVERAQQGIFGYTKSDDGYYDAIMNWMWRRHRWRVASDWIITTSGVMNAIALAIQTYTKADDGVIIQTPVFQPFSQAIIDNERRVVCNPLLYEAGGYHINFHAWFRH